MIQYLLLGLIKVLDNIIITAKNITTYQNKKIVTGLLTIISQFMFYYLIKSVVSDGSNTSIAIICICSGIGTFIAMQLNEVFKS